MKRDKKEQNIKNVKDILLHQNPILFIGAGFSYGSSNEKGDLPTGPQLNERIFKKFVQGKVDNTVEMEVKDYDLPDTCQFIYDDMKKQEELKEFIFSCLKNAQPCEFHLLLNSYPWSRIYSLNVDDLVENICKKNKVGLVVQNTGHEKATDNKLEYIKLHGCVNEPSEAIVFSRSEYTNLISTKNYKLDKLYTDIVDRNIIFIGASMEESDIDYIVTQYEKAGALRKGKFIFVDPYPKVKLKSKINNFDGILLQCTAEDFLKFVADLKYDPTEEKRRKMRLNYNGFFLYQDILTNYSSADMYESRLYEGFNCNWQDIFNDWVFESQAIVNLEKKIEKLSFDSYDSYCVAIYGNHFVGKDCALKLIGAYLAKTGYEVVEYRGKSFNINEFIQYIKKRKHDRYALLIQDAGYYYKLIEKLLEKSLSGKKLLIVSTSRTYNHKKKRYYLEDNPYFEYEIKDRISWDDAQIIYKKIKEKGYLGDLSLDRITAIGQIMRKGSLINLFSDLTYGSGFKKQIKRTTSNILKASEQIRSLYIDLVIFDMIDLPYYPSELLNQKYSINFNIFRDDGQDDLSSEQKLIIDYVRIDTNGISLKNRLLIKDLFLNLSKKEIVVAIKDILVRIATYVSENDTTYWRIIFESLLKEAILSDVLKIKDSDILNLYYALKKEYEGISYYWLQLGIAEQKFSDFSKALNHLKQAQQIRPKAYQIEHAIARNYLKHANSETNNLLSVELFNTGENMMLKLINSQEGYKKKAQNYSIHCYAHEKIKFMLKHQDMVCRKSCLELKKYIDRMEGERTDYYSSLIGEYVAMLKKYDMQSILSMKPGDAYYNALTNKTSREEKDEIDILIDSL